MECTKKCCAEGMTCWKYSINIGFYLLQLLTIPVLTKENLSASSYVSSVLMHLEFDLSWQRSWNDSSVNTKVKDGLCCEILFYSSLFLPGSLDSDSVLCTIVRALDWPTAYMVSRCCSILTWLDHSSLGVLCFLSYFFIVKWRGFFFGRIVVGHSDIGGFWGL